MNTQDIADIQHLAEESGLQSYYHNHTDTLYITMEYPDPDTCDVYTEDVPVHSLKEAYDLLGW
jgi:hypothetical protein